MGQAPLIPLIEHKNNIWIQKRAVIAAEYTVHWGEARVRQPCATTATVYICPSHGRGLKISDACESVCAEPWYSVMYCSQGWVLEEWLCRRLSIQAFTISTNRHQRGPLHTLDYFYFRISWSATRPFAGLENRVNLELRGVESLKSAGCIASMYVLLTGADECTGVTTESAAHHIWKLNMQVFPIEAVAYLIDGHGCWAFGKPNRLNCVENLWNLYHASLLMTRNITIQRYHAQSLF